MTKYTAEALVANGNDLEVRPGYSGRGMFGETTFGVVGSKREIEEAILETAYFAGQTGEEAVMEDLTRLRWDNMGLDFIAY
jgi:hypothetical protein